MVLSSTGTTYWIRSGIIYYLQSHCIENLLHYKNSCLWWDVWTNGLSSVSTTLNYYANVLNHDINCTYESTTIIIS